MKTAFHPRRRIAGHPLRLALLVAASFAGPAAADDPEFRWSGGSTNNSRWSDSWNWDWLNSGGAEPTVSDPLLFGLSSDGNRAENMNDFPSGSVFDSLKWWVRSDGEQWIVKGNNFGAKEMWFTASYDGFENTGFEVVIRPIVSLDGSTIELDHNITTESETRFIEVHFEGGWKLLSRSVLGVTYSSHPDQLRHQVAEVSGPITGLGELVVDGAHLRLSGANSAFSGRITVESDGLLSVESEHALGIAGPESNLIVHGEVEFGNVSTAEPIKLENFGFRPSLTNTTGTSVSSGPLVVQGPARLVSEGVRLVLENALEISASSGATAELEFGGSGEIVVTGDDIDSVEPDAWVKVATDVVLKKSPGDRFLPGAEIVVEGGTLKWGQNEQIANGTEILLVDGGSLDLSGGFTESFQGSIKVGARHRPNAEGAVQTISMGENGRLL